MKHKKTKLFATFLIGIGLSSVQAQQGTTTSGGDVSGSGGSVSYSIGQVVYTTNTGTNGSVAQGIQQPYEIFAILGLKELGIKLSLSVYPNPTADFLNLKLENYQNADLSYQLCDVNGKLIENKKITSIETNIMMSQLLTGGYFLTVTQNNIDIKTFKIIKN